MTDSNPAEPIDFAAEKAKRVHDLNDKRLAQVRAAFSAALPLPKANKPRKKKTKKKR
ncbi:hypothetical protein SAMN05216214_102104 [Atopomonas hussainii]|uniref:Uncharacterized protein n=1 Tax=Atopomonas hussainii TaxID=1429083 RepID=A0A1H7GK32_9GAMM|nr:hypothetical protein [Atopomonas hussainii]SEK38449.1 hypothetical protein SAMN05216214_102104 [Atopomonas hussainii]